MKTPTKSISFLLVSLAATAVAQEVRPVPGAAEVQVGTQPQVIPAPTRTVFPEKNSSLILKIDTARLVDTSGQLVGKVEYIVLNPTGCAEAAIVAGERGKLIPVPWEVVRFGGETRAEGTPPGETLTFVANTDRTGILAAPGFLRTEWPVLTKEDWLQKSYVHFQVQPGVPVGAAAPASTVITGSAASTNRTLQATNRIYPPLNPGPTLPPSGTPPGVVPPPTIPPTTTPPTVLPPPAVPPNPPAVAPPSRLPPPGAVPPPSVPPPNP